MSPISRRQLIQCGLGSAFAPLPGLATIDKQSGPLEASSYLGGKMKGFAIGTVEKRSNDVLYFDALAATGANVARVGFPFKKCRNCTQFGRSPADVLSLKRILDWARKRDIKIVVVGGFDDQDKPTFWNDNALRESFVTNWEWFAATFQNDPALAGLDLMNEPNPPRSTGKLAEAHALWRPLAERAIAAIRAAGVTLPVIYEGVGGGQVEGLRDFEPFNDRQVVYSVHVYTTHHITHQRVAPAWPLTIPYPAGPEWQFNDSAFKDYKGKAGGWDRARLEMALKDLIAFQRDHKVPIFIGEFSCVRWAPNGSAARYIADCLEIFQKYGWSWCYHEFRGWPGWDAEISSEEPSNTVRSANAPVMALLHAEMMSNKRGSL